MASPALRALWDPRLREVRTLVGLRPAGGLFRKGDEAHARAINRACVVVLTAHLEGFIEELVVDIVDVLNQWGPATSDLPQVLLAAHVLPDVEQIAEMQDVNKRATRLDTFFQTYSPLWLDQRLSTGRLRAKAVTADLGNPGAKEIARVLRLVGLEDPFAAVQLPDGADPEKRINELVGVRNAIAHGGGPSVSDDQLDRYITAVEQVGLAFDQEAASQLQALCRKPVQPWT